MCVGAAIAKNPMWAISPGLAALGVGKKKKRPDGTITETGAAPTYGPSPSFGG